MRVPVHFTGAPSAFDGDHERRVFRIGARALAEAAADVAHLEDELLRRHFRVGRELRAHRGDALHRGVDPVRFRRRVVGDEARPRLHGTRRHARRDHFGLRDVRRGGESRFDGLLVADLGLPREIARHLVGQLRRAGGQRAFRIGDALQVAILDFDEVGGVLRGGGAVGDDQCDGFADETDLPVREHRAVRGPRLHAVLAGELHGMRRLGVAGAHRVFAGEHAASRPGRRRAAFVFTETISACARSARTKWP